MYGVPVNVRFVSVSCDARTDAPHGAMQLTPRGNRLSGLTTTNGTRATGGLVASQTSYPPEVSAIPSQNCDIWCQLAGPVVKAWAGQMTSQPVLGLAAIVKSAVMPAFASAMIAFQSAAARSAGVRATFARKRAL